MELGVSSDGRPSISYTLGYLAESNSPTELSVIDVMNELGLSAGSAFGDDPNATLQKMKIKRLTTIAPYCAWDIGIVFATNAKVPENPSQDPTQMRVKMSKRYG